MSDVLIRWHEPAEVDSLSEAQVVRSVPSMYIWHSVASTALNHDLLTESVYWPSASYVGMTEPFNSRSSSTWIVGHSPKARFYSTYPNRGNLGFFGTRLIGTREPFTFSPAQGHESFVVEASDDLLQSVWLEAAVRDLGAAANLANDGRDSPAQPQFVAEAFNFLLEAALPTTAPPLVAPLNDGGIQLEWHRGGIDVELVFSPDENERGLWVREQQSGEEMDGPLDPQTFRERIAARLEARP